MENNKYIINVEEKDVLDTLIDENVFVLDEEGLPVKNDEYAIENGRRRNYSNEEMCNVILPYVYQDFRISSREIARKTGLDPRTINKCRKTDLFKSKLAQLTNDRLLSMRCTALETLESILKDKNVSTANKIKACTAILQHSVSVAELAVQMGNTAKPIDIDVLLKEIESLV